MFFFFGFAGLFGQQITRVNGMTFSYTNQNDSLNCTLKAETRGWVGIGFNSKNSIVGSDLLLFNIVNGHPSGTDLFVQSAGNPKKDSVLGGKKSFVILNSKEHGNTTTVQFSIPLNSGDPYDYTHKIGKPCWLILAYSVADEFEHHSRMRKHVPFTLLPPRQKN